MLHKMTPENWRAVITTNLDSLFNMTRNVIEGMRGRGYGRVISISSINGQKGQMGQANYSAAKAGLIGFTKAAAQENAFKGITVNAIAPGYVGTEMVRAVPEEVLKAKILPLIPVGQDPAADPGRPPGRARRGRPLRRVPGQPRRRLHHRLDAERERRAIYGVRGMAKVKSRPASLAFV
jgi:NAD(P)-dependent dehydrogenase (short-subunit alcohol dehydrogenase family)